MNTPYKERIARRLTWVTALIFLGVFLLIYLVANFTVIRNIDRELQLETEKHQGEIFLVDGKIKFLHRDEWAQMEHTQLQLNPIFIEIVDMEGKSMDKSPNLRDNHLSFSPEAASGMEESTQRIGSKELRQRQIPLFTAGKQEGYLLLAKSFEDSRELLDNLRNVLLLIYPLLLISLYLTMRYLAGKSIAPLEKISQKTNQITQQNLSERVPDSGARDEIGLLTQAINNLLERLEQAMQREKQFTSDASHELRTPLSVLRGTLEVLIRKPRTAEEYEQKVKTALGSIDRMSAMIDQLLALARVENGKNLIKEELELITFLEELADKFTVEQQQKITFQSLVGHPIYVRTNEKSLEMILDNLLENAIKYTQGKGEVVLRVGIDQVPFIDVVDAGFGISPEQLEQIFDPFFRSQEALDRGIPGTGLGLAIVKKLAQESGLQLSVSSTEGQGSTFRLAFPTTS
jgi:two-component system, OmpR family, sensor kinase